MRILGVDPGLKATGYGFVDFLGGRIRLLEAGTIEPKPKDALAQKVDALYKNLGALILEHRPEVMVLEKLYAHYKHPATASIMGHARGVICLLCAQHKVKLVEYSVKKIRQALIGNGNASKLQTQSVVAYILKIDPKGLTLDASDALALSLGYVHFHCRPNSRHCEERSDEAIV